MSRASVKFFYGPLYLTPYICCGREPGMWGYPGCVWISIGWLTWSVQFSLSPPRLKTLPRQPTPSGVTPPGGAAPFQRVNSTRDALCKLGNGAAEIRVGRTTGTVPTTVRAEPIPPESRSENDTVLPTNADAETGPALFSDDAKW